jgi:hypothetical protein
VSVPEGGELGRKASGLLVPGGEASAQLPCTRLTLVPRLEHVEDSSYGSLVTKFAKRRRILLPLIYIKWRENRMEAAENVGKRRLNSRKK